MEANELSVRKLIVDSYLENLNISQCKLAKKLKISRSTVQSVLQNYRRSGTIERKAGSGRKSGTVDKKIEQKAIRAFKRNPNLSERAVAAKVGTSSSTVHRIKQRANLKTFKVQKVPDRDATKDLLCKTRARKLYTDFLTKFECCVMDDETYCVADFNQIPGQEFYVAEEKGKVAPEFKNRKASKYPKKYLIWQAICSCGKKTEEFITKGTINTEIYTKECLEKRLLPLIQSHNIPVVFWPDLATCHYSKKTLEFYEANSINVIPKEANPPNCPELRPIERYWAHMKSKLKRTKFQTNSVLQFRNKWRKQAESITERDVQILMGGLKSKVRIFWRGN